MEQLKQIIENTHQAIYESQQKKHPRGERPYHEYAKGFCRYNPSAPFGAKNRGSFIKELTSLEKTFDFINMMIDEGRLVKMTTEEARQEDPTANPDIATWYKGTIPLTYNGYMGGKIYRDLPKDIQEKVVEVDGDHGLELVLAGSIEDMQPSSEFRLITSKPNHPFNKTGLHVLATTFVGPLAPANRSTAAKESKFVKIIF